MRTADQAACLLHILERLLRCQGFADRFFCQMVQMGFENVLRRDHQGEAHGRVFGHLVEQGIDGIAPLAGFAGQMAGCRRRAQTVDHDGAMGHAVEEPEAVFDIGSRLAEKQPLREVSATGKFQFAFFGVFRIGSQAIEALAVFVCRTQQRRSWIEPGQQPGVDRCGIEAVRLHTGIGEAAS